MGMHNRMEELIDIAESSSAMKTLYDRVAERYREVVQEEIFEHIEIPPLGAHPEKKPQVTKLVMKRLEEKRAASALFTWWSTSWNG